MAILDHAPILFGYFAVIWICLRLTFSKLERSERFLLPVLVLVQLSLKLVDRFYLPSYSLRAGDEKIWLLSMQSYQETGVLPLESLAQGPGIFYLVGLTGGLTRLDLPNALVILAIIFGSLYVVPAFFMYEKFSGDAPKIALVSVILVSFSDVMIYSTTIARPTLFGLFLIPIAFAAFQALFRRFRWSTFLALTAVSALVLVIHAPITYLVLLLVIVFTLLIYDEINVWQTGYTLIAFTLYALVLRLLLSNLDRIWRTELLGAYPLNLIPSVLGDNFVVLFPIFGLIILAVSWFWRAPKRRLMFKIGRSIFWSKPSAFDLGLVAFLALVISSIALVLLNYSSYVRITYRDPVAFLLLHGWKIPIGILALLGIQVCLRSEFRRRDLKHCIAFSWLLSLIITVFLLAIYPPLKSYAGLWNLDERFAEFAYYPAFYFIGFELEALSRRIPPRIFNWLIIPLISLIVIPAIIVGTRDLDFFGVP